MDSGLNLIIHIENYRKKKKTQGIKQEPNKAPTSHKRLQMPWEMVISHDGPGAVELLRSAASLAWNVIEWHIAPA